MFVWFLKEKKLVPEHLFNEEDLKNIVKDFYKNKSSTNYYNAILQNLFFATLNRPINERKFAKDEGFLKNRNEYGIRNLYRYENMFLISEKDVIELFSSIPFVNGGLFDCLDDDMDIKSSAIDGFTRNDKYRAKIPDYLFFQKEEKEVDLSKYLKKAKKAKVRGLIEILKTYHFTIDENTSIDQDISLDPEMLGKVFENLLAAYNPETSETAKKSSGSYYTPREIVDYMVDESLINYIKTKLPEISEEKIRSLFSYTEEKVEFSDKEKNDLIEVIDNIKIIDPACGSGAFPMGVLHKLVLALEKIDPDNKLWQERQYKKILEHYKEIEKSKDSDKEEVLKELNETFDETLNNPNYARKLYIIENSIYGVDIHPIAVQISKLRFFISLLIEQKINSDKGKNYGIRPLPNLETKFVIANTLIGLEKLPDELFVSDIQKIIDELFKIREDFFYANSRHKKKKLEGKEQKLKEKLIESIQKNSEKINKEKIQKLKIEIEKLNKELDNLASQPDEIEIIEIPNLFGEKEIKKINKTKEKRKKIKGKKIIYENEIRKLESSGKEQTIEIAKKIADFNPYDQNKSNTWFDPEWMFGIKDGFDIVIMNPPYVNIYKIAKDKKIVKTYQKLFFSAYKKFDLYILFLEKSINILKFDGILCSINSDKFMSQPYGMKIRQYILSNCQIKTIYDLSKYKIFEEATNTVSVFIFSKEKNKNIRDENMIKILVPFEKNQKLPNLIQCKKYEIPQKLFYQTIENQFRINLTPELLKIIRKIESSTIKLGNICYINWGCRPVPIDNFVFDKKINQKYKLFIRGENVVRYNIHWDGKYLFYEPKKLYNPMFPELFENEKIIVQEVTGRHGLICAYDNKGYYTTHAFSICVLKYKLANIKRKNLKISYEEVNISKQYDLKYLLSLMNSKLLNVYFKLMISGELNVYPDNLKMLPIKPIEPEVQKKFIDIVDQILSIYEKYGYPLSNDILAKVRELEDQIDQLVYQLYDLTPDEIKIIEGER